MPVNAWLPTERALAASRFAERLIEEFAERRIEECQSEERATLLLRRLIGVRSYAEFLENGVFVVTFDGQRYRLGSGRVEVLRGDTADTRESWCVLVPDVCRIDTIIAQYMGLKHDPHALRAAAAVYDYDAWRKAPQALWGSHG